MRGIPFVHTSVAIADHLANNIIVQVSVKMWHDIFQHGKRTREVTHGNECHWSIWCVSGWSHIMDATTVLGTNAYRCHRREYCRTQNSLWLLSSWFRYSSPLCTFLDHQWLSRRAGEGICPRSPSERASQWKKTFQHAFNNRDMQVQAWGSDVGSGRPGSFFTGYPMRLYQHMNSRLAVCLYFSLVNKRRVSQEG